ncbi:S-layer homology domain-containing protein [Gudongella sp. DL1XJH-153]|uniref:S-layer homology domain-containing protein n=1 Tax=Gudongella sp. DL1XJH-153 TaxID=3409804 RepID=UPI003BB51D25
MKKHLALVLALVMVLSSFSFVSAAPDFADVKDTMYEEAVDRLELLNVLKGYPDGTFRPDNSISRAEFAAVAVRARGLEGVAVAAAGLPSGFSDVPANHWAAGYVGTAASMGIVNGIGNGMFAPAAPVKYEEAVTMLVRALGYENDAQAKGGYPFGYLIVAEEIDLLDDVRATQGTWASRGMVAMLTDNALEIPMMISVGSGDDARWIVSGEDRTDEQRLLDFMGFEKVNGVVEVQDMDDMEIELDGDEYVTPAGFDFFVLEGAEITAWVDGDDIIVYTLEDEILFGAVDANADLDEIEMVKSEDEYDVAEDVVVMDADFAKVVINGDDEVSFFEGYDMDGFILVDEIDDEMILDLNEDEVDVEDFVVLKGEMTVSIDDLEEGDVVFYVVNDDVLGGEYEGLAVAYNESVMGEISRVYTDGFRLEGDDYKWTSDAQYLDDGDLGDLTADLAEGMMDEEMDVEAFLDFNEDVVLLVGDTGEAATSKFYAVLIDNAVAYVGRGGDMLALDLLNEFGEEMELDIAKSFIEDGDFTVEVDAQATFTTNAAITTVADEFKLNAEPFLFEVEVDEDGDLETLKLLAIDVLIDHDATTVTEGFEIDDTYAAVEVATDDSADFRLMSSTVVFYEYDTTNLDFEEVATLGEVEDFSEVEEGFAYVKNGRIEVALATMTDADTDTTDYTGLVTDIREIRGGDLEITIEVFGVEMEFVTADGAIIPDTAAEDMIWTLVVGDTSNEIDEIKSVDYDKDWIVDSVDVSDNEIVVKETATSTATVTIELIDDAVIYDVDDDFAELRLRDVTKGDVINVVFDEDSNYWVAYVLVDPSDATVVTGLDMTYTTAGAIELEGLKAETGYTVRVVTSRDSNIIGDFGFVTGEDVTTASVDLTAELTNGITYVAELYYTADLVNASPSRLDAVSFTAVSSK